MFQIQFIGMSIFHADMEIAQPPYSMFLGLGFNWDLLKRKLKY